ncbi:Hypothetical protein HDN1F_19850 [gamma proteobacterium HdN1]|nr:Hypothetical protein HDN1F_19850 [gamma proteobacterium HdN1]
MRTSSRILLSLITAVSVIPAANSAFAVARDVPALSIRWDCGKCTHNPKVIELLEQTYADAAAKEGVKVSSGVKAEVVITDFRQRHAAMRLLTGAMSGGDRLQVTVRYQGKMFTAKDDAYNVVKGANWTIRNVGKSVYEQLAAR